MTDAVSLDQWRPGRRQCNLTLDDGTVVECEEVVRVVPGKRIVFRGVWQTQAVYAKLFIGRQARHYAERDLRGVKALLDAGIATPALLHQGRLAGSVANILIFAAIPDSINTDQAWAGMSMAQRFELAAKVVREVALHHQAGLMQTDLYLKNFLLQGERIYTLDGDAIKPLPQFLGQRKALDNLALLLSKFDIGSEADWLPRLLEIYAAARALPTLPALQWMRKRIAVHRHATAGRYADSKVFRQCTDIDVWRSRRSFLAVARPYASASLKQRLAKPEQLMAAVQRLLKRGNTCTVALTRLDGHQVVVKRYNIKGFRHGLGRAWRRSRAAVSWSNAHRLLMYGIATPIPVALIENRFGPIRRQAYFVTQYVEAPDAMEFFAATEVSVSQKKEVAERIADMLHKLCLLQLEHGDLKASNIKIADTRPMLIDLDSMRQHRCRRLFRARHQRDLRRLMNNWQQDDATRAALAAALLRVYQDKSLLQGAGIE